MSKVVIPTQFDKSTNFFDYNPELRHHPVISKYIRKRGEEFTSSMMWAIYMVEDPDSKLFSLPLDKKVEIATKFLGFKYDYDKYDDLINTYRELLMTKVEAWYSRLVKKFDKMLAELESENDLEKSFNYFSKIKPIFSALDDVKKMYDKERNSKVKERGRQKSGLLAQ